MVKEFYGETGFLLLLITPYSDLNLSKLIKLAEYVCKGYQGTFKRTDVLYGDDPSRREKEREKSSSSLASLIHHYVFKRRENRGGVKEVVKDAYSTILFSESRVKKLRCNVKAVGEQLLRGGILVRHVEGSCIRHPPS